MTEDRATGRARSGTAFRAAVHALTRPLPARYVVDRERSRTRLVLASALTIVLTLLLPQPGSVDRGWAWMVAASVTATGLAGLWPRSWPVLNRLGGVLLALQIAVLVEVTGGARSPYPPLFVMLMVYASIFYDTRRLAATTVVVGLAAAAPHLDGGAHGPSHWTLLAVQGAVCVAMCAIVHALVGALRARTHEVQVNEQRYRSLFEHNPDAVYSLDDHGRFTAVNAAAEILVGRPASTIIGRPFSDVVADGHLGQAENRFSASLSGASKSYELAVRHRDGRLVDVAVTTVPIVVDGVVVGVHGVAKDVSERNRLQRELSALARQDVLTGLANRRLWQERLEEVLAQREPEGRCAALLLLDLDGFKAVNDSLGHAAGDDLLVQVAERLRPCVRPWDTVARLGGDEFALLLPESDQDAAVVVADRVLEALRAPFALADTVVRVSASVGVTTTRGDAAGPAALLRDADAAMYRAKRAGRDRLAVAAEPSGAGAACR